MFTEGEGDAAREKEWDGRTGNCVFLVFCSISFVGSIFETFGRIYIMQYYTLFYYVGVLWTSSEDYWLLQDIKDPRQVCKTYVLCYWLFSFVIFTFIYIYLAIICEICLMDFEWLCLLEI